MTIARAMARCWAEIDIEALRHNYERALSMLSGRARLIAVLKANAYGAGAKGIARCLSDMGARDFAVATYTEAEEIIDTPGVSNVLVMGLTGEDDVTDAMRRGITLTAYSISQIRMLRAAAARGITGEGARPLNVHVKIETGLHRLGLSPESAPGAILELMNDNNVRVTGAYTHLALRDSASDDTQFERFERVMRDSGARDILWHACDSIGMVRYPEKHYGAVRVGAWLYGVCPYRYPRPEDDKLIISLKARISQIRALDKGECVGYDDAHPLERASRVATLSAGYVDGCPRHNNAGEVEIRGKRARILGLVCMDQMMADVTDIPEAREGDEVTLLGASIGVDEYAAWAGMNRNEAISRVGRRVPRVYISGEKIIGVECDMEGKIC